jgi:TonB-linked SusC/RagA family outer membrane protein
MKHVNTKTRGMSLAGVLLLLALSTQAQRAAYTFRGTVTAANGEVLPGASVLVRGTTSGAVTNAAGAYTFTANLDPGPVELLFRSVGYREVAQAVTLGTQTTITTDATLTEDALGLDEVVVTGSTLTASRRQLGNAISSIKAQDLERSGTGNLFGALQGKVPGAQITQNSGDPAGGLTVRLRGVKSLQGSSDPLYVVDGVIVSNASTNVSQLAPSDQIGAAVPGQNRLADLNPQDIETINVINGAAAAAIYGSRASNGVVLITTKRGKSGAPRFSFTTSFNVNELRKRVPITTYGKQFGFAGLRLYTIGSVTAAQLAANPGTTVSPYVRDGATANLATNLVDVTRYDYQDNIFHTGTGTDNSLSISGGSERMQYFASVSYLFNQGIIKNTDFRRYGLRLRVDQRLTDWAKLSAGVTYTNSYSNEKPNGNVFYSPINSVNITNNIYDITRRDAAGNLLGVEPTRINPLTVIEEFDFNQSTSRTINDVQLNLTPLKGLSVDWIIGVDAYSQLGRNFIPPYPYAATAGLPLERFPQGFAANATNQVLLFNSDVNATYTRAFGDLSLTATAGLNYQFQRSDFTRASGQNLTPFIETVSGASSTTVTAGYGLDRFAVSGQFVQATLGYRNGLFLTGALRRDGSTLFSPSQTNQLYPKLSASWVVSDFVKGNLFGEKAISSLKLRASYGDAGGVSALGTYDRFWQFNPVGFLGAGTILPDRRLANPGVRPERMRELEGGLDLGLLNDRVALTLTGYSQRITDLVVSRTLAASQGGTSITTNVGEMTNKGLEIGLTLSPVRTKDVEWDVTLIYNQNRNRIVSLGSPLIALNNVTGAPAFLIEGQPASVFRGTYFATNPDGTPLLTTQGLLQSEKGLILRPDQLAGAGFDETALPAGTQFVGGTYYIPRRDASGQPTGQALQKIIGNPNPKWTGSISSNLRYRALNLRFLLDAVQGVQVFNADKRTRQGVGIGNFAEQELRGDLPRGYIYGLYNTEEWRIDNGSFVKLREVSLSYTLPQLVKGLSNLTLGVAGRNLISWDQYNGYDPETNAGGNSDRLRGIDFGNVPVPRTYQVSLSATF